jgi:hypothetical protein
MSSSDDLMGISDQDKKDYAESENAASNAERADDEWDIEEADDPKPSTAYSLDGFMVNTLDWLYPDPSDIALNIYVNAVQWLAIKHANSAALKLQINRYIGASIWRGVL